VYDLEEGFMRTNVVLDDKLVAEAMLLTGLQTKRGVIDHALKELIRRRQQRRLLELRGRVKWEGNLSKMRQGRFVS
jgi:Arc/MetJ family transcription regulator